MKARGQLGEVTMTDPLTPELLRSVGEALYGDYWQSALARDLGVASRTVRRWAAGGEAVRPRIADEIYRLILRRRDALQALVPELAELLREE